MDKHTEKSWWREVFTSVVVAVISAIIVARLGLDKPSGTPEGATTPRTSGVSESTKLIGSWRANVVFGNGMQTGITWQLRADGTAYYQFVSNRGGSQSSTTWQYSDGVIYEWYGNGTAGKGAIRWIDNNHFELTILDNAIPAVIGQKLHYYRK